MWGCLTFRWQLARDPALLPACLSSLQQPRLPQASHQLAQRSAWGQVQVLQRHVGQGSAWHLPRRLLLLDPGCMGAGRDAWKGEWCLKKTELARALGRVQEKVIGACMKATQSQNHRSIEECRRAGLHTPPTKLQTSRAAPAQPTFDG